MDKKETKKDQMHIRIEPTLKRDFERAAKEDGRTMAGAIQYLMQQYVKEKLKGK